MKIRRDILKAIILISLTALFLPPSAGSNGAVPLAQGGEPRKEWEFDSGSGIPFWIGLNFIGPHTPFGYRQIFVFVEPQIFSEETLRTIFFYLSQKFPLPEMLSITVRSDQAKLSALVQGYRAFSSLKPGDKNLLQEIRSQVEKAEASAMQGCYRANYVRVEGDERFEFFPDPNKRKGRTVVLNPQSHKFVPSGNLGSDLVRASKFGLIKYVKLFIDQGANVNALDPDGYSPLVAAVLSRQTTVMELLLQSGAEVDSKAPNGWTALVCALTYSRIDNTRIAEELIRRGANVNAINTDRETVLIIAVSKGQRKIVEELLARGADVNVRNSSGKTALMIAEEQRLIEIQLLLTAAGAVK